MWKSSIFEFRRGYFKLIPLFLIPISFPSYSCKEKFQDNISTNNIPYEEVLNSTNIKQSSHDNIVNNSLLIGNGDINGMVYSQDSNLVVNLSKNDVWDARLDTEKDPPLMKIDIANQDSHYEAKHGSTPASWNNPYPCPRICAKLVIKNIAPFNSELDIHHATAKINRDNMQIRALANENVFLINSQELVNLESVEADFLPKPETGEVDSIEWITQELPSDNDWKGMSFAVALGRNINKTIVSIVTSLDASNPKEEAIDNVKEALKTQDSLLIESHERTWDEFWCKSGISLDDEALTNIWYRSLYFMRCVSKPGVQAVSLYAGSANDNALWHGSYTLDYNVEQTFWGPFNVNHAELSEPYDRLISEYLPRAKWFAQETYGIGGAFYPVNIFGHESSPENSASRNKRMMAYVPWTYVPGLSGFVAKNLWLKYKFNPDLKYLKTIAYPVLKESSIFYCNFMDKCKIDENGKVLFGPSFNPEHGEFGVFNTPFDLAFIRFAFNATIEGAKALSLDEQLIDRITNSLALLPDYPKSEGDEPEIVDWPGDKPGREHNISATTVPVFPAEVITWFSEPEEKEIFARTLENMRWNSNNAMIMLGVSKARLSMDDTWKWMKKEFLAREQTNGTLNLSSEDKAPFNSFGIYSENFSSAGAITELLLQSVEDIIRVFPAWPKEKDASFANLRAQGGFLVSAIQEDTEVKNILISSTVKGKLQLISPWDMIQLVDVYNNETKLLQPDENGMISIYAMKNKKYLLKKGIK